MAFILCVGDNVKDIITLKHINHEKDWANFHYTLTIF